MLRRRINITAPKRLCTPSHGTSSRRTPLSLLLSFFF
jgi:hypothetical protein